MAARLAMALALGVLFAATGVAAIASALEVVPQGRLLITFDGAIVPAGLPGNRAAPVGVRLIGRARTLDDSALPRLRRFAISINRNARLRSAQIPRCRHEQVKDASDRDALKACGRSVVGRGRFGAFVDLPDQPQIQIEGRLLAFNSRYRGRQALLAHVYAPRPVQTTLTFPMTIRRTLGGPYGITFVARLADNLNATVYATDLTLNLGGRFAAPGPARRYLSAACPAPRGFPSITFPLARGAFNFQGGRRLVANLTDTCQVRG